MSTALLDIDQLNQDKLAQLDEFISQVADPKGSIIKILHEAQNIYGYIPQALQLYVARKTGLPAAKVNGIVSFYSFFNEEPSGKYAISVCMGTACFVKGSAAVLKGFREELKLAEGKNVTDDGIFSLRDVRCIGACGLAPVVSINGKIFGKVKQEQVSDIIKQYLELEVNEHEDTIAPATK